MHELSIAESVVATVLERTGDSRVTTVRLRAGRLCAVVPDAMHFCFDLATSGTPLEGAELEIEETPGTARCRSCAQEFGIDDMILLCPCGSADVEVLGGRELAVTSVEVV